MKRNLPKESNLPSITMEVKSCGDPTTVAQSWHSFSGLRGINTDLPCFLGFIFSFSFYSFLTFNLKKKMYILFSLFYVVCIVLIFVHIHLYIYISMLFFSVLKTMI